MFVTCTKYHLRIVLVCGCLLGMASAKAQEYRHAAQVGTQFPLQYAVGYAFQPTRSFSGRIQAGLLLPPYDRAILRTIEFFGFDKRLSKVVEKAFRHGNLATLDADYHFRRHYVGVQGQFVHLKGETSAVEAARVYFGSRIDIPDIIILAAPRLRVRSNLLNAGVRYGYRWVLPNPRCEMRGELSFTRIVGSDNRFSSNLRPLDQLDFIQQLYQQLDRELTDEYRKHGYLPGIGIYFTYRL